MNYWQSKKVRSASRERKTDPVHKRNLLGTAAASGNRQNKKAARKGRPRDFDQLPARIAVAVSATTIASIPAEPLLVALHVAAAIRLLVGVFAAQHVAVTAIAGLVVAPVLRPIAMA